MTRSRRWSLTLFATLCVLVWVINGAPRPGLAYDCPYGCPTYEVYETHWDDCGHCGQPFEMTWWHDRHRTCCVCDGCDYWILDGTGCDWCP